MALSALSLNVTDSQDYKINFPAVLREQFGFTFPKVTASTSDNKTFSAESENFMGSPATVTIVNNVITRMAPGIIRDIVRQFVCSPERARLATIVSQGDSVRSLDGARQDPGNLPDAERKRFHSSAELTIRHGS